MTLPNANCQFDEFGFHGRTTRLRGTTMCALPAACALTRRFAVVGVAMCAGVTSTVAGVEVEELELRNCGRPGGGGSCVLSPPSPKTMRPGRTPPFDDVGVPPIVIATYSLPSTEKIDGPAAIWRPVWNFQRTLP